MVQTRNIEYIPIASDRTYRPDWTLDRDYGYATDVFLDLEHYDEDDAKVLLHFPGGGVTSRYPVNHSGMRTLTSKGIKVYVVYYYHTRFNLEELPVEYRDKVKLPWKEDWGDYLNYGGHLIARSLMVQSALDYVGSSYLSNAAPSAKVYLSGKSRGGATLLAWLATHTIFKKNFPQDIRMVFNSQGYAGSGNDGFLNYYKTRSTLAQYFTFLDSGIKAVHNYNDDDYGYDLTQDLTNSIPRNRLSSQYFVNEPPKGHQTNWELLATLISQDSKNEPLSWNGVELKSAYEIMRDRIVEKNSWPNVTYNI